MTSAPKATHMRQVLETWREEIAARIGRREGIAGGEC